VFIEAKDDGNGGNNWSIVQSSSQIVTTNKPTPSFLQAGCPSCRPTNNVMSKHCRRFYCSVISIQCFDAVGRATGRTSGL